MKQSLTEKYLLWNEAQAPIFTCTILLVAKFRSKKKKILRNPLDKPVLGSPQPAKEPIRPTIAARTREIFQSFRHPFLPPPPISQEETSGLR